jgi:hypothetical protein
VPATRKRIRIQTHASALAINTIYIDNYGQDEKPDDKMRPRERGELLNNMTPT